MNYSMEELAPVAGGLIRKYGGYENSSVTYEKAEQLMGAVIYCIREYEVGNDSRLLPEAKVSALAAYQAGYECVMHKAKRRKLSAQIPVLCCSVSTGLGPRSPADTPQTSRASGISASTKSVTLA